MNIGAGVEIAKKTNNPSEGSSRRRKRGKGRRQMTIMSPIKEEGEEDISFGRGLSD